MAPTTRVCVAVSGAQEQDAGGVQGDVIRRRHVDAARPRVDGVGEEARAVGAKRRQSAAMGGAVKLPESTMRSSMSTW
jgi:hypothetical protein